MNGKKEHFAAVNNRSAAVAALALLIVGGGAARLTAQGAPTAGMTEKQMTTTQSKFYCNIKALTPDERVRHKQLATN